MLINLSHANSYLSVTFINRVIYQCQMNTQTDSLTEELAKTGGVYIETTQNPQNIGFSYGDTTRSFDKIDDLSQIKEILGIELIVSHSFGQVKVSVVNPNSVGKMLLSRNDDVGSSVKYARISYGRGDDPGSIEELVASAGQHICIEPFNFRKARIQVYPIPRQLERFTQDEQGNVYRANGTPADSSELILSGRIKTLSVPNPCLDVSKHIDQLAAEGSRIIPPLANAYTVSDFSGETQKVHNIKGAEVNFSVYAVQFYIVN